MYREPENVKVLLYVEAFKYSIEQRFKIFLVYELLK